MAISLRFATSSFLGAGTGGGTESAGAEGAGIRALLKLIVWREVINQPDEDGKGMMTVCRAAGAFVHCNRIFLCHLANEFGDL